MQGLTDGADPPDHRGRSLVGRVVLGRFRILAMLARGGMGEVYLARSEGAAGFHRPVVVKRVLAQHADDKMIVALFRREARVMASLRHPNIVSVLDFGEDSGDHLMVIEYVHGSHLGRWLRWLGIQKQPFPVERALHIMITVLEALRNAHDATGPDGQRLQIVHRDVSPGNVLIDVEGTVKLADFGVARMQGEHTEVGDSGTPSVLGKFPFLAPELFDGTPATPLADVYAAGVVLDEILRGKNAFKTGLTSDTVARVLTYVPTRLDEVRPDVSADLAELVARAISKDPAERPGSADAFAEQLRLVRESATDDAQHELAAAARRDFLDPAMARALEVPELPALESLWHGPAPATDTGRYAAATSQDVPTIAVEPPVMSELASPQPTDRRRTIAFAIAAGAVSLVAGGVALAFASGAWQPGLDGDGGPVVAVVDHTTGDGTGPRVVPPNVAVDAGASTHDATSDVDAGPSTTGHVPTGHGGRPVPIEAAFRARAPEIGRCFTDYVSDIVGTPEVVVHFDVSADGRVAHAGLTPGALEGTAFGRCLVAIARTTRFAPQAAPISFHVPLGARRVGH